MPHGDGSSTVPKIAADLGPAANSPDCPPILPSTSVFAFQSSCSPLLVVGSVLYINLTHAGF